MDAYANIEREELAGFALILVYWWTLVLAHYYFETRVMQDRVRAEIRVARHRAAVLWEERSRLAEVVRGNGHPAATAAYAGRERRAVASVAAKTLVVVELPTGAAVGHGAANGQREARDPIVDLLDEAERTLDDTCHGWRRGLMTFLGWESAPELSALQLLNAADVLAWSQVSDETAVSARIVQAHGQIGELTPDQQRVWNGQFAAFWRGDGRPTPLDPAPARRPSRSKAGAPVRQPLPGHHALALWRSRLCAFLGDLYESRQVRNARLSSLQQKASWGVLITLWVLVALVATGDGRVLLAGAIGGLLSRMTRFNGIRWVTTDFGLGWAQLYLAPPVGALAAWGGIHVLLLAQGFGAIDLRTVLQETQLQGTGPHAAAVLGLAIALGFSERLFDRLLRRAADTIVPPAEAQGPTSAPAGVRAL